MRILIACEFSGIVREAFRRKGWHALSCDLLETDQRGHHYQGDVRDVLDGWEPVRFTAECDPDGEGWCQKSGMCTGECYCLGPTQEGVEYREIKGRLFARPEKERQWDMMIAHPPCTYLSASGMHWTRRGLRDPQLTEDALEFVRELMDAPIERIALENPVGVISTMIRKPDQIVQPWQFGHDASKKTCLWLKGLEKLRATEIVEGRLVDGRILWGNQTPTGQNNLGPREDRWKLRSATYEGIAEAMAEQWGGER